MKKPNDKKRPNSNSGSMGKFLNSRRCMAHISAQLINHPLWLHAADHRALSSYTGPRWLVAKGTTLFINRNALKRQRRELMVYVAGSERAHRRVMSMARARIAQ